MLVVANDAMDLAIVSFPAAPATLALLKNFITLANSAMDLAVRSFPAIPSLTLLEDVVSLADDAVDLAIVGFPAAPVTLGLVDEKCTLLLRGVGTVNLWILV